MNLVLRSNMRAFVALCLLCLTPAGILAQTLVDTCKPVFSTDVAVPVSTNSVFLQDPRCCFNSVPSLPCTDDKCEIWLVAAVDTAVTTFDANKSDSNNYGVCPCPSSLSSTTNGYFLSKAGVLKDFPCPSTAPNYLKVGQSSGCPVCSVTLPEGGLTRYKYLLVNPNTKQPIAESQWSDTVTLKTSKDPGAIGGSYAGRSASMVVITAILGALAALLLLLLLIALIVACCCRTGKGKSYNTTTTTTTNTGRTATGKRNVTLMESLRIPKYDVHHLNKPTLYDNMAFERDGRTYTTSSTLPQQTVTTVVHHNVVHHDVVQPSSPDKITLHK